MRTDSSIESDPIDLSSSLNLLFLPRSSSTPTREGRRLNEAFLSSKRFSSHKTTTSTKANLLTEKKIAPSTLFTRLRYDPTSYIFEGSCSSQQQNHRRIWGSDAVQLNRKTLKQYNSTPYDRPLPCGQPKSGSGNFQRCYSVLNVCLVKKTPEATILRNSHLRTNSAPVNSGLFYQNTTNQSNLVSLPYSHSAFNSSRFTDRVKVNRTFHKSFFEKTKIDQTTFLSRSSQTVSLFHKSFVNPDFKNKATVLTENQAILPIPNILVIQEHEQMHFEPEYFDDIFKSLLILEKKFKLDPQFMKKQIFLTWGRRAHILDSLTKAQHLLSLPHPVIFAATNLFDRICSLKVDISSTKLPLYSAACFLIAAKAFAAGQNPSSRDIIDTFKINFSPRELSEMEQYILITIDFQVLCPTPVDFLGLILMDDSYHTPTVQLCRYLANTSLYDPRLTFFFPSVIAASSLCFSRLILGRGDWSRRHEEMAGYSLQDLLPCLQALTLHLSDENLKNAADEVYGNQSTHCVAILAHQPESVASALIQFGS